MHELSTEWVLAGADATEAAGAALARCIRSAVAAPAPVCIFLQGELGAGKTTFARGFMRGCGYDGRVPSPTYTLVEPYEFADSKVWHLDLYRLGDGAELEYLGVSEMTEPGSILLIEWPDRGEGYLPPNDLQIKLKVLSAGRALAIDAVSPLGERLKEAFLEATAELR